MKKIIRLSESDLTRIVKRVINEDNDNGNDMKIEIDLSELGIDDMLNTAMGAGLTEDQVKEYITKSINTIVYDMLGDEYYIDEMIEVMSEYYGESDDDDDDDYEELRKQANRTIFGGGEYDHL
jgi:hypothetical protein